MLAFEERLGQFAQQAAPSIDELMAMAGSAHDTGSVAAAHALLIGYGRAMHHITGLAANASLPGLHSLCALVETNLLLLQDDNRPLTPEESAALSEWPMLLLGYVANHASRDASQALLQGLSAHWPISLPPESTAVELKLLTGEGEPAVPQEEPAPHDTAIPDESPEGSAPMEPMLGDAAPVAPPAQEQATPELPQTEEAEPEAPVPEPTLADSALPDAAFEEPAFSEAFTPEQAAPEQTTPTEGEVFADQPEAAENPEATTALLPPPDSGLQHVARPQLDILLDELKPLDDAFESVIAAATEGSDDDRLAALGDLLDFLERLKVTVETIGLSALAALLAQITTVLSSLPGGFREQHRDLLQRLPRAMMAYLNAPDAPAASAGLVVLLADERWPTPLSGDALAAWRSALSNMVFAESGTQTEATDRDTVEDLGPLMADTADSTPDMPDEPESKDPAETVHAAAMPVEADVLETADALKTPAEEAVAMEADFSEPEPVAELESPQVESQQAPPLQPESPEAASQVAESDDLRHDDALPETGPEAVSPEPDSATHIADEETETATPAPLPPPETGTQHVERPMLIILLDELEPLQEEFATAVAAATHGSEDERLAALGELLDFLERVKVTVEAIGLTALAALLTQVSWELISLPEGLTEKHQELLNRLPPAMTTYLQAPDDVAACEGLATVLGDTRWPALVSDEALAAWQSALADIELSETSAELTPARPSHAAPEDISLSLPAEVNSELLEGLLHELPVQVSAFTTAITSITGPNGTQADSEQAMRAAHTLKGAANTVGIPGIANLTHHIEDILVALIEAETLPHGPVSDMLINAGDCLEAMSEYLLGLGPAPDDAQAVLQQVLDWANRMDREGLTAIVSEAPPATGSVDSASDRADSSAAEDTSFSAPTTLPSAPAPAASVSAASEQTQATTAEAKDAAQAAAPEQSLRVPAPLVDELLSLAGETLISNSQLQDHLKATLIQNRAIHQQHQLIQRLLAELETQVDIRGITSQQSARQGDAFDTLEFEHYSELQTISRQLMEAAIDAREMSNLADEQLTALEEVLDDQLRLQMSNQRALLRTRMMPVSNVVPRLQRSVRQTGRLLDKPVQFTVKGENTSMDTNVLNDLMDPLMHMLRNAVDHGIETREARLAAGKPEEGHIELAFAREGDTIVVRCRDDGAGLNYEAIRRIAESKGIIMPGHVHSHDELARLILAPGFSTRGEASQVSGRGVGMDVVYSRIQEMKGMLALHSQTGHGLTVELRIPASLLSMHALIIRQREKRLAISTRGIEDIRYIMREDLLEIGSRQFVRDGDKLYGLLRLEQVLSMPHDRRAEDRRGHPVLLIRMEDGTERAVLVQEILESREVVMKKFSRFVPQANGVIGAAILGNGEVAPVVDLFDLLHTPMKEFIGARAARIDAGGTRAEAHARRALVVDDSLSARRAVVQVLKDEGYEIRTANDGLDAVSILEKWIPDIVISDMEMPRMNGLELTTNIRRTESTKHVPVVMITSRSTAKHREMSTAAGVDLHMIKPFSDDELARQVARLMEEQT